MAQALGRVVDSSALDACGEARGRHAIEIPVAWIGAEISVSIPARVVCARCDGGGCDGCNRRGGYRLEGDDQTRTIRVQLPHVMTGTIVLRLVRPFGDTKRSLAQLHLETRVGSGASSGVVLCTLPTREIAPSTQPSPSTSLPTAANMRHVPWVVAATFVLGILAALATMR